MLFQTGLGVYIENDRLSMAYLKASFRGIRLVAHSIHGLEKEGSVKEKLAIVAELVRDFLDKNQISSADIFLAIPREMAILRYIELPLIVKENLRETLGYEMEKYVPFSADDVYFDFQVIAEDKEINKLKVLLVVVKKESAYPYFELGNQLGGKISGIEISSTAVANFFSCKPNIPDGDPFGIAYLRGKDLELNVVKERALNYSRFIELAEHEDDFHSIVSQELRSIRESYGRLQVAFCAPDADAGLFKRAGEEADLEVYQADLSETGISSYDIIPAYGLALKGTHKVPMDINLLPTELRKKASKAAIYAMFVLAGLLVLSALSWGGGSIVRQRIALGGLNEDIKRLGAEIANIEQIQTKCKALEDRIEFLNGLGAGRLPVLNILKDLSERIPDSAWVRKLTLSGKAVEIEGEANSASELISLIETSPLLEDVVFLSPITKDRSGKERFRIGFKVE